MIQEDRRRAMPRACRLERRLARKEEQLGRRRGCLLEPGWKGERRTSWLSRDEGDEGEGRGEGAEEGSEVGGREDK